MADRRLERIVNSAVLTATCKCLHGSHWKEMLRVSGKEMLRVTRKMPRIAGRRGNSDFELGFQKTSFKSTSTFLPDTSTAGFSATRTRLATGLGSIDASR